MKKFNTGIAVHAGAGPDSDFVRKNQDLYLKGLKEARDIGYTVLSKRGSALDAVEAAVMSMEDNPIFNAGKGSALNSNKEVQMYASVMDGKSLRAGAGCLLKNIKNPVHFARKILEEGRSVFLGGLHAHEHAVSLGLQIEPDDYFITDLQINYYEEERLKCLKKNLPFNPAVRGTVGAVALDSEGNVAAATSTGGTIYSQPGRIGDTSMVGVGTYADNRYCAVSCTGDGEALIKNVVAHAIVAMKEYLGHNMHDVCKKMIHEKLKDTVGDMGAISIDRSGNIGIAFNTERMHRAWKSADGFEGAFIYP